MVISVSRKEIGSHYTNFHSENNHATAWFNIEAIENSSVSPRVMESN